MTKEALKLALEAMESVTVECNNFHHPKKDQNHHWAKCPPVARWDKAITAIKEALAQTQEPVAWEQFYPDIGKPQIEFAPVKIVAYNCTCGRTMNFESDHGVVAPQRTWVGLTEQERNDIEDYCEMIIGKPAFDAIEAKLKQKNHVAQETNS